jgi:glycosyltransferase involved in cell wall biosynthesis
MNKVMLEPPVAQSSPALPLSSRRSRPLTAVMVDASCFTLPYDYSLCDALGEQGCRVILERSEFRAFQWVRPASSFQLSNQFYRFTQRVQLSGKLKASLKAVKAAEHLFNMREFVSRMRELRPDVIHFQWLPVPILDRLYLEQLSRIAPLVFTVHNTNQPRGTRIQSMYQKLGWNSLFPHIQAIVAHSAYSKRRILENKWATEDKIHVVPHGVFDYYRSLETSAAAPSAHGRSVLFFGAPEPYKGLDVLLRAFALLPPEVLNDTQLVVAGRATPNTASLQALSKSLGIDHRVVWQVGSISENDVPQIFRSATLVAIPYRYIDVSGVLMTALALGKVVVANRSGGNPDIIQDGVHGRLVDPESPESMANALQELLTNPDRLRSMERAVEGLASADFSWTTSAQKTIEVYEHVVNGSR